MGSELTFTKKFLYFRKREIKPDWRNSYFLHNISQENSEINTKN